MVGWLAAALNSNLERCKMRPDPARSATDGFMLNLAGVSRAGSMHALVPVRKFQSLLAVAADRDPAQALPHTVY
jgi:hypothetical protein